MENYPLALFIDSLFIIIGTNLILTADPFLFGVMIFQIFYIQILQYKFKNMVHYTKKIADEHGISFDAASKIHLKYCIEMHQDIITYDVETTTYSAIIINK